MPIDCSLFHFSSTMSYFIWILFILLQNIKLDFYLYFLPIKVNETVSIPSSSPMCWCVFSWLYCKKKCLLFFFSKLRHTLKKKSEAAHGLNCLWGMMQQISALLYIVRDDPPRSPVTSPRCADSMTCRSLWRSSISPLKGGRLWFRTSLLDSPLSCPQFSSSSPVQLFWQLQPRVSECMNEKNGSPPTKGRARGGRA